MSKELTKNTEQKIIEVATELFAKKGFEGTSTRDICNQAGVNISLISYYFGGKEELYRKIVETIVNNISNHMRSLFGEGQEIPDFSKIKKEQKICLFFRLLNHMIDYFYSEQFSDSAIIILFREQITSGIPLDAQGYLMLKRLLASIIDRNEDDKEVILRCLTIVGQIHSARVIKQFSLKLMNQDSYSSEDILLLKHIIEAQVKSTFIGLGVLDA